MKRWLFLIIFCLCWLMFSCSSTPPAEETLPEEMSQESVTEKQVFEKQVFDTDFEEESTENTESINPSLENTPAEDELLSSVDINQEVPPQDDFQDYLQEIEIVDLLQEDALPSNTEQEDAAVIVDSEPVSHEQEEGALIVEIPSLQNEEVPLPEPSSVSQENGALVVESVETEAPEEELVPVETEEEVPVLAETELAQESVPVELEPTVALEQEDDSIPEEINETQGVLDDRVVPSRSVVMDNNQYLDIRYPGVGWVYLGEVTEDGSSIEEQNLTYFGRRRTSEDTSFTMKSSKPGKTILHFYKQDILTATFIDDYLEVTITEAIAQNGFRVIAPSYESIVPGYQDIIPQPKDFAVAEVPTTESPSDKEQGELMNETMVEVETPSTPAPAASTPVPSVATAPVVAESAEVATTPSVVTSPAVATSPAPAVAASVAPVAEAEAPVVARTTPVATPSTPAPAVSTSAPSVATVSAAAESAEVATKPSVVTSPAVATSTVPAVAASVASVVTRTTPAPTTSPRTPEPTTAPVIVPPQTPSQNAVARGSSAQVSSLQQEVYEPEPVSSILPRDSYNPETGLSMEDLDLPWVNEESETPRELVPEAISTENQQAQDALLAQAQDYFYEEDYPAALASLDEFFEIAVNDFDAAYYLKGQILESKSPIKNVKEAQKAYKQVIDAYPQSPFWERSKNRYTYLSRFYFDIR